MNLWTHSAGLPPACSAVLAALHLSEPRLEGLHQLDTEAWQVALDYSDRARLTLALRQKASDALPAAARERVDRDFEKNQLRIEGIQELYSSIQRLLRPAGIEFVALKGLTHAALFQPGSERHRMQYDVDLYLPREAAFRAREILVGAGWESLEGMEAFPTDHLPALIRRTGWEWRGDFFDPNIPLSVELHFRFWNEGLERLPASGTEKFWDRRTHRMIGGVELGTLCPPDALAYACLHLLKHVLRGSVKPFHMLEIATILDGLSLDEAFWNEWRNLHSPDLRRLQAVTFRLAESWFGGRIPPAAQEEIDRLPDATRAWFHEFAASPAAREFHPNKDELWLHLSLLPSRKDRWQVARRRLLPGNLPPLAENAYIPKSEMTWTRRMVHLGRRMAYVAKRIRHHAISLPQMAASGLRWWWHTRRI